MGYHDVICPKCGHTNERFISESACYTAEERGYLDDEAELTICGKGDETGCGRTLQYLYVPSAGEMVVEMRPTHDTFLTD